MYDGHGGREVAQYASEAFPKFLKHVEAYQKDNMRQALIDAFLGFDGTLVSPEVVNTLKIMTKKDAKNWSDEEEEELDDDVEEENVANLYEEAHMPIELVIQKYEKAKDNNESGKSQTACEKPQTSSDESKPSSSNVKSECSSSGSGSSHNVKQTDKSISASDNVSSSSNAAEETVVTNGILDAQETKSQDPDSTAGDSSKSTEDSNINKQNGEITPSNSKADKDCETTTATTTNQENGEVIEKGKSLVLY